MPDTPSLPPRGSFFSQDGADVVFAAIRTLDESTRQQVLVELQQLMADPDERDTPFHRRVAKAMLAVREAHAINLAVTGSEQLTSYRYDQLQQERMDRHDWPPIATVRSWLAARSWNEVLARCHLPQAPDGDSLQRNWNHAFDPEEAIAAVQQCAQDLDRVPSWWEYLHWSGRTDVRRRPGRRPRSQTVFDRLWPAGGWSAALIASGLAEGDDEQTLARVNDDGVVVPAGYRYSPETLRRTLRQAAGELGDSFGASDYDAWRSRQMERRRKRQQPPLAIPSRYVFFKRYRTWVLAMADAGLTAAAWDTSPLGRGRKPFARELLVEIVREAYADVGDPFTKQAYRAWRERQLAAGDRRLLPTVETIARHFGGWKLAHQQILGKPRDWW